MEDAKLQNLIIELVFFFLRIAIKKALPVSTQSFASFVYKIKHIHYMLKDMIYCPKIVQALEQKCRTKVPSQLITTAQKAVVTK